MKLDELHLVENIDTAYFIPLIKYQKNFGYTQEDIKSLIVPMARTGEEAISSMGDDCSLVILSNKDKTLYHYFRQLFTQVTNPQIDSIREAMVMSLVSFIGSRPNLLDTNHINSSMQLEVSQPILNDADIKNYIISVYIQKVSLNLIY